MTAEEWKTRIIKACEEAGTYRPFYDDVIATMASILEKRDYAAETFKKTGGNVLVTHYTKTGAANLEQNPALRLMNDLNRDALAYWRDLGLTPAGYKKLTANVVEDKTAQGFEKLLEKIGT